MSITVLLFASWVVYLASFIGMLNVFPCGFGKHLWSVTVEQLQCYMNVSQKGGNVSPMALHPIFPETNTFATSRQAPWNFLLHR